MTEKEKCIHAGHRKRLIDTVYKVGLDGLSDIQILEYILFFVFPRGDVNPLAHRLLDRFHNISTVLEATIEDLQMVKGMGETSAKKLHSIIEIFYIYALDKGKASPSKTVGELYDYLEQLLRFRSNEEVYIIGISKKGEALKERRLATGSFQKVDIDIKDVALYIATYKVSRAIIVHNHPNGTCYPSQDDYETTAKFKDVLKFAGCSLSDSLIVGSDGLYSIESNAIKRYFKDISEDIVQEKSQQNMKKVL